MSVPGSITALVERLRGGDQEAVRLLWQRYYPRLVALARRKLQGASRRVADEEKSLPVMDGPPRCGGTYWRTPRVDSLPYRVGLRPSAAWRRERGQRSPEQRRSLRLPPPGSPTAPDVGLRSVCAPGRRPS